MFAMPNELALLEKELQHELARLDDKDVRQKMRSIFHRTITLLELRVAEAEDDVQRREVIPLPAPKIAGLLPAKIPERLPKENEYRVTADAAKVRELTMKERQAEQTRAHYARHPEMAARGARQWGVSAETFVEAMASGGGFGALTRLQAERGLYRELDCGGTVVNAPGERVYVGG